ncbi:hypothetical protein BLOT_008507 [Blomia tropicalis]|nr:hypothetical protein BLOT_008507 [Blomia tropicalis]
MNSFNINLYSTNGATRSIDRQIANRDASVRTLNLRYYNSHALMSLFVLNPSIGLDLFCTFAGPV